MLVRWYYSASNDFIMEDGDDSEGMFVLPPPGEEAMSFSHAGGEYQEQIVLHSLLSKKTHQDDRDRADRVERQVKAWELQLPTLVEAYLAFRANGPLQSTETTWSLQVMDFSTNQILAFSQPNPGSFSVNDTLLRHGFIGSSPDIPTLAFSLSLFDIFRQINRVCPRFSLEALARSLHNLHQIPYNPHCAKQLRTAYNAYLTIIREVKNLSGAALDRISDVSFHTITCPPCTYELANETKLSPRMLLAMDGNSSLKLVDPTHKSGHPRLDTRMLQDHRWIDVEDVDVMKDEVANAQKKYKLSNPPKSAPSECPPEPVSTTGRACVDTCVDRWKAAAPDSRKKMFGFFSITGIFLAVCRHGHVLALCDMRKSSELMKYPLAITHKILKAYGEELGIGYDIMCAFYQTLLRSEKLQSDVLALQLRGVVPSFHGHAHNRKCQLDWHPMYVEGVGLEDFEECEHTFSGSNSLASTTRLSTEFHRLQAILEYFAFHDEDKHAASGNFIYQNYRQALQRLATDVPLFEEACVALSITPENCEQFLAAEREHFKKTFEDPAEEEQQLEYVELLRRLWSAVKASDDAAEKYKILGSNAAEKLTAKQIGQIEARYRTTYQKCDQLLEEVADWEVEHGISERWTPETPEYLSAEKGLIHRQYRHALEELERLVVQRLFELTKLNMSGVGYKQRTKITQALRSRAEAIRKALEKYNSAAERMDPPRETLSWNAILEMVTLADFDLLKNTHLDISQLPWAKPKNREAMQLHFGIRRAKEEISRLNIEIKRLITFMIDDHADYHHVILTVQGFNPDLASELIRQQSYRLAIHARIVERLQLTSQLEGFTGDLTPGERLNRDPELTDEVPLLGWATDILGIARLDDDSPSVQIDLVHNPHPRALPDVDSSDEDEPATTQGLVDFFAGLAVNDGEGNFDGDDLY
ncbi:hypothetical protein AAF712_015134 [Marasmius tenuissimus]|uniref:CxC1-like cysteine cluster associated with KDZ transposases domain-containing protein n=1 Tax=Marasmius tenuissimus TaxID=585030 RepID=A0ABR2ZBC7_9AGAR